MFKYIWILMIVFVVGFFVAYTVYCCIQEFKDAESLEEWCNFMWLEHEALALIWSTILVIVAIILFITSLFAFCSSCFG